MQIIDLSDNVPIKVKKYFVEYTNMDSYKEEKYNFGITALKELVAHKIQNSFEEVNHPDIPYLIAELIIDKELPELKDNDKLKILLCDAALMHLHPAQLFFETIEKLKGTSYPKSPALFYKHIFKDLRYEGKLGNFPNTIKLFDHIYQDICSNYKDAFKSEIFNEELIWLLHILKNAREIRLRNPLFIIDLINSKGKFTIQFKRIIKQLGTPFFINSLDEGGFIPPAKLKKIPKQVYILFSAAELLLNAHGKKGCAMFGLCSKNYVEKNVTNDFCKSNPFERIGEADACSFVQLCKTWGIHEKQYVI
ncbi:MAG TPA: hypothetical protein VF465_21400 [Flavobacterium sp.]|uniref:hypothetical protein n=1 Tax=Flavobacterium sp. TaxID=239 RepID=UPI002ED262C4